LLFDPVAPAQRRFVGARIVADLPRSFGNLAHERGLADLARTGHHLDEAAGLPQTPGELLALGTGKHCYDLLNILSKFTQ
jgi:hypothetical protein